TVNFLDRLQQLEREIVTVARKKVVGPAGEPVNHFRATHFLRPPPGIEITVALESKAMLLDAHVTHLHARDELVNGTTFGALKGVENFEPLGAADFGE